jgi:uncharacterized membrane protein
MNFEHAYLAFIIYSIGGWIAQGIWVGFRKHHFVNTGFLYGPYVPIYGFGSLLILYVVDVFGKNPIYVFFGTMILCSVLEYFTSWAMQKLFHHLWWNYSKQPFNLNGRICLLNSVMYGLAGLFITFVTQPWVDQLEKMLSFRTLGIFEILFTIVFVTDLVCTLIHLARTRHWIANIHEIIEKLEGKEPEPAHVQALAANLNQLASSRLLLVYVLKRLFTQSS